MTLWVLGWVEVNHQLPEERLGDVSTWQPLLSLDPFGHLADHVSDYLFGIAKRPKFNARFPERGVPPDASDLVQRYAAVSAFPAIPFAGFAVPPNPLWPTSSRIVDEAKNASRTPPN